MGEHENIQRTLEPWDPNPNEGVEARSRAAWTGRSPGQHVLCLIHGRISMSQDQVSKGWSDEPSRYGVERVNARMHTSHFNQSLAVTPLHLHLHETNIITTFTNDIDAQSSHKDTTTRTKAEDPGRKTRSQLLVKRPQGCE
jgi:hypothetical protein